MTPLRAYAATASMAATAPLSDRPLFLIDYGLRVLRVVLMLAIWRTILDGGARVEGLSAGQTLTYTLVAAAFASQLQPTAHVESKLWDGAIAGHFTRPTGVYRGLVAHMAGSWLLGVVLFTVPLLAAAPILGVRVVPASVADGLVFVLSLFLGVCVGLAIDLLFAAVMVHAEDAYWEMAWIRDGLTVVLSGALVPLAVFPDAVARVLVWSPFGSIASTPLLTFVGAAPPSAVLRQAAWAVVLWPPAVWLWRRGGERMVAYGG